MAILRQIDKNRKWDKNENMDLRTGQASTKLMLFVCEKIVNLRKNAFFVTAVTRLRQKQKIYFRARTTSITPGCEVFFT